MIFDITSLSDDVNVTLNSYFKFRTKIKRLGLEFTSCLLLQ